MKRIHASPTWFMVLLTIFACCAGAKYYLANAPLDQLRFLLSPPTLFVEVFYSCSPTWNPEHGYVFDSINMHIGRSCAAINFLMLLISAATTYAFLKFDKTLYPKAFAAILLTAYPITVFINSIRIVALVMIEQFSISHNDALHEAFGACCFFGSLVLMFSMAERFSTRLSPVDSKT